MDNTAPRNRKERRRRGVGAAAGSKSPSKTARLHDDDAANPIPLAQPDRSGTKKGKTLYDLASEREALLQQGRPFQKSSSPKPSLHKMTAEGDIVVDGEGSEVAEGVETAAEDDAMFSRIEQSLFYAVTLTMLHFTLDVLVHHQYRQEMGWSMICGRAGIALPSTFCLPANPWNMSLEQISLICSGTIVIFGLVYALHGRDSSPLTVQLTQLFFLGLSVSAGCYLVYAANEEPYFAVMKRAPPLGTLWVWSVIELKLQFAVPSLLAVAAYLRWGEYSVL
ncbi:MAG: U4/U6-U5 snRNP complex subunit lsm3 [Chaenotheca gracillima]|nr:MAG: U4/U6-U5 snRNP complex subunit lsm3 [Chaenotheca gracillima]